MTSAKWSLPNPTRDLGLHSVRDTSRNKEGTSIKRQNKSRVPEIGERAQQLRARIALTEDLGWVPDRHT